MHACSQGWPVSSKGEKGSGTHRSPTGWRERCACSSRTCGRGRAAGAQGLASDPLPLVHHIRSPPLSSPAPLNDLPRVALVLLYAHVEGLRAAGGRRGGGEKAGWGRAPVDRVPSPLPPLDAPSTPPHPPTPPPLPLQTHQACAHVVVHVKVEERARLAARLGRDEVVERVGLGDDQVLLRRRGGRGLGGGTAAPLQPPLPRAAP